MLGDPDVTEIDINVAGEIHRLSCDKLVAALGFTANLGPLLEWGIAIAGRRHIAVDTQGATSVPGVYAAGDIVDYDGKVRLIATGFGEVATAVNNAAAYSQPVGVGVPGTPVGLRAAGRHSVADRVIVGVGIDVVPVARFAGALARTPTLADRLFTPKERVTDSGGARSAESLAARFAREGGARQGVGRTRWHALDGRGDRG